VLDNSTKETSRAAAAQVVSQTLGTDHEPTTALLAASLREMLLRLDKICAITGLSVATLYRLMARGDFPRPLKITSQRGACMRRDSAGTGFATRLGT
jgi:hypothetical protein